ncbi:hypothetical protein Tco_0248143 [Tanacetum coccineum]
MGKGDDEIKVFAEINVELQSGTDKLIEKLSQEKDSIKFDWQDDPYHETEDLFVELDQAIEDVVIQNNVPQKVAGEVVFNPVFYEEVVKMANDQD